MADSELISGEWDERFCDINADIESAMNAVRESAGVAVSQSIRFYDFMDVGLESRGLAASVMCGPLVDVIDCRSAERRLSRPLVLVETCDG